MQRIIDLFFSPHAFRDVLPDIWSGFQTNIHMMVVAEILVLIFALGIAVIRGIPGRAAIPLRALAVFYVDFFRGTPLIIVALVVGVGVPSADAGWISSRSPVTYGIVALTIVYSAYVAEVYRAGIESIHQSQRMAARSLGLSYTQTMRYVVLPQAIRRVVPPLLNDFIGLQKDTAIVFVIGIGEAVLAAQNYSTAYTNFTGYTVAAVFFVMLTIPLARFTDNLIRQRELRERAAA
jgi:polar amino acid transport system permease protein